MSPEHLKLACVALVNHKVHAHHAMILLMADDRPITMKEISDTGGFTTSNATGLVDYMCSAGWVERTSDEEDRRKVLVKISEPGIAILNSIKNQIKHL